MFGYASNEVADALMPAPIHYSHKILERLAQVRHSGEVKGLEPDAKSQVSIRYENGRPVEASAIVLSTQHADGLSPSDIADIVKPYIKETLPEGWITDNTILSLIHI